jgi:large subunit ribosomal protein L29
MKAAEIRELTDEELAQRSREAKQELLNLRLQQTAGQIEKPSRIRDVRRNIARIETIINEREKAVR